MDKGKRQRKRKKKKRTEVTLDGETIKCRVPRIMDLWHALGSLPTLPSLDDLPKWAKGFQQLDLQDREKVQTLAQCADALLARVAIKPKLILEDPDELPAGTESLAEYELDDKLLAFTQLLVESGYSDLAAEDVRPT